MCKVELEKGKCVFIFFYKGVKEVGLGLKEFKCLFLWISVGVERIILIGDKGFYLDFVFYFMNMWILF